MLRTDKHSRNSPILAFEKRSGLTNGDIVAYNCWQGIALRIVPGNMHCHSVLDVAVAADLYVVHISCDAHILSKEELSGRQRTKSNACNPEKA